MEASFDHKGYRCSIEFDEQSAMYHAQAIGLRDGITAEAATLDELEREWRTSVDDYLDFCAERGEIPDPPPARGVA